MEEQFKFGCPARVVPLVTCRVRFHLFRILWLCRRGAPTLPSRIYITRQQYRCFDVIRHSPRIFPCLRVRRGFGFQYVVSFPLVRSRVIFSSMSSLPHLKSKDAVATGDKRGSAISISDQLSFLSTSIAGDFEPNFKITELSPSDSRVASSVDSFDCESQGQSRQLDGSTLTVPSTSVTPHLPDTTESIPLSYSSNVTVADTV